MTGHSISPAQLFESPNALAPHYSRFRVADRLLLTGHSHQAWPDVSFEAQERAWLDAARLIDDKWAEAERQAKVVRAGWRRLLNDPAADVALGQNTHELVVRWLSALCLPTRPRLVTTDAEFHSFRRQADRLSEERIEVVKVAARPVDSLAARVAAVVDSRTAGVLVSSVLFETAEIVPGLHVIADACEREGASLLIDAYHHLNVVPFDVDALGLSRAFVTGGGYKYCQLGEGNGFLRVPVGDWRPVITGWFAEFGALAETRRPGEVAYGTGAAGFAGATYDPTAHYRAATVFAFYEHLGLTPELLREVSRHQAAVLIDAFERLDIDPAVAHVEPMAADRRAGFVAIRAPRAGAISAALKAKGVFTDARGDVLRLGPAPYLTDDQLRTAIAILGETLRVV